MEDKICLLVKREKTVVFVELDPDAVVSELKGAVSKMTKMDEEDFQLLLPKGNNEGYKYLEIAQESVRDLGISDFSDIYMIHREGEGNLRGLFFVIFPLDAQRC